MGRRAGWGGGIEVGRRDKSGEGRGGEEVGVGRRVGLRGGYG